jgi:deoxyribose-phosphate aldolase
MYIDFYINDPSINESEAKQLVKDIVGLDVANSITLPYYLIKSVKPLMNQHGLDFSCFIDYPLGISDNKTRLFSIEQAHKCGINTVDITIPQNLAANRKYEKIREDVKSTADLCNSLKINLRYILEYRVFDHHCLKKICEIFDNFGIKYVFPSSGYFIDNLADNILASIFLHQNSKDLNIISSGNIWSNKHFELLIKSKIFGFRTNSIHSLKNFVAFNLNTK